jgi:hypothetical protein
VTTGVSLAHPSGGITIRSGVEGDTIVFRDVPPGDLDLMIQGGPAGIEWLERSVHVPAGASVDLGTLHVGAAAPFRVRIVDAAGAGVVTSIAAVRPDLVAGPLDLDLRIGMRSDADGWIEVGHLAPGRTLLWAGGREGLARVAREVDTTRETELELVLRPGTEVVLTGPRRPGQGVVLEGPGGLPYFAGTSIPRECFLAPGAYVLVRSSDGIEQERIPFQVGDTRTVVRWSAE